MQGGNQTQLRRVRIWRVVGLLVVFGGMASWCPTALAAEGPPVSERFRPNASVRSVRSRVEPTDVAQVAPIGSPSTVSGLNGGVTGQAPVQDLPAGLPDPAAGTELGDLESQRPVPPTPSGPQQFRVPLQEPDFENMRIKSEDGLISLVARNSPLRDILTLLAETQGLNIVTADPLTQPISVTLERVQLNDALDAVLSIAGYTFSIQRNIIFISSLNNSAMTIAPQAQGLRLEVFQLDYVMALDVNTAVTGMLSPIGQSYIVASSATDNRRSRELVAVNDLPQFLDRIRQYVAQVDLPPRQVMIEAHIFQVDLDDQNRHGVNFDQLFRRNGNLLFEMHTAGFANPAATQAFTFRFSDGNLNAFLEALRTQTDAKTLASPRILVLNGQQARLQVGQQLGFRVTTTTETSTTESVDFLDVGVVLEVTPRISRDGKIMMSVKPEVSSGQVNPTTGLPEEETTELDTDILLCDHEGIMIGGLIQETDDDLQTKIAWVGDLPYVGRLFQRRTTTKRRREIIITLIPRLLPFEEHFAASTNELYERADTPLLQGPLNRVPRPWEPRLSDAIDNPVLIRLPRVHDSVPWNHCPDCGQRLVEGICRHCRLNQNGSSHSKTESLTRPHAEGSQPSDPAPNVNLPPPAGSFGGVLQSPANIVPAAPVLVRRLPPIASAEPVNSAGNLLPASGKTVATTDTQAPKRLSVE